MPFVYRVCVCERERERELVLDGFECSEGGLWQCEAFVLEQVRNRLRETKRSCLCFRNYDVPKTLCTYTHAHTPIVIVKLKCLLQEGRYV